jgi:hypothetical protein
MSRPSTALSFVPALATGLPGAGIASALATGLAISLAVAAGPAAAQILKCRSADGTVSYSQSTSCPAGSRPQAMKPPRDAASATLAEATAPVTPDAPAARALPAGAVPDAPLPLIETGVPAITQLAGQYGWLDGDTLALTTYAEPPAKAPWMVRRIVAFDVARRSASTLVARGFVDCVDPAHALVGLELGDLEAIFGIGSKAPPPVPQFQVWNSGTHALAAAPAGTFAGWHPHACLKTEAEDLAVADLALDKKPLRYLEPEHGVIAWGISPEGHPEPPTLRGAQRHVVLPLSINDISHEVRWLPFAKAYQLSAGTRDTPLITMDLDGRVAKRAVPAALAQALDAAGAAGRGRLVAVRGGALFVQPGPARQGGGLYLVQGERSRRVWCTASPAAGQAAGDDACTMSQPPQVAPDGCSVAFDARPAAPVARFPADPTFKVIELCTAADKGKGTHVTLAR